MKRATLYDLKRITFVLLSNLLGFALLDLLLNYFSTTTSNHHLHLILQLMITNDAKIFYKILAEDLSVEVLSFVSSHLPFPLNNFRCNFFFVVVGEKRKGISQNFEKVFFFCTKNTQWNHSIFLQFRDI